MKIHLFLSTPVFTIITVDKIHMDNWIQYSVQLNSALQQRKLNCQSFKLSGLTNASIFSICIQPSTIILAQHLELFLHSHLNSVAIRQVHRLMSKYCKVSPLPSGESYVSECQPFNRFLWLLVICMSKISEKTDKL